MLDYINNFKNSMENYQKCYLLSLHASTGGVTTETKIIVDAVLGEVSFSISFGVVTVSQAESSQL